MVVMASGCHHACGGEASPNEGGVVGCRISLGASQAQRSLWRGRPAAYESTSIGGRCGQNERLCHDGGAAQRSGIGKLEIAIKGNGDGECVVIDGRWVSPLEVPQNK
jgi:hypothetical protein